MWLTRSPGAVKINFSCIVAKTGFIQPSAFSLRPETLNPAKYHQSALVRRPFPRGSRDLRQGNSRTGPLGQDSLYVKLRADAARVPELSTRF